MFNIWQHVPTTDRGNRLALLPFRSSQSKRFDRLVLPYMRGMYNFAYRLTGQQQDAEDLVQDVVVKLYPRLDELEKVQQPQPWLNRVLYRHFVDLTRKQSSQREINASMLVSAENQTSFMESLGEAGPDASAGIDQARIDDTVKRLLNTLPPDQRTLLLLHDADGWRQEDIAQVLDVPVGTIKSRLHRSRAFMRERLKKQLEPFERQQREG
ncbi:MULTISPECIES: RNA polymerase sigma factor [Marinobacter]|uniref:RNA polymerase sigma factor n=1 Tax=Marinobacter TaxID=2742 RepID=UPI001247AF0D|nr:MULTISPECIES: RNA polymerase sigma factor [Marinobacter]MBL3556159.1 RNA polymerase sigma factor [Marinobacter sp. JB05H06]